MMAMPSYFNGNNNLYSNPYYNSGFNANQNFNMNFPYTKQQVVRVNGYGGANAYQLPPNSSVLLLDTSAPIVWLKTTDGASYATVTGYNISPISVDNNDKDKDSSLLKYQILQSRIAQLERKINEQSNITNVSKQQTATPRQQQSVSSNAAAYEFK